MILEDKFVKEALQTALDNAVWQKEGKDPKKRNFNETLDLIINFRDLDIRNPNNKIDRELLLPNNLYEDDLNICFFSKGDQLLDIKEKGYPVMTDDDLEELNNKDVKDKKKFVRKYDAFIAQAPLMRDVAKTLGRYLGQSGKMPKPQPKGFGIVSPEMDVDKIVENFRHRVKLRTRRVPMIQTKFGKKSYDFDHNYENLKAILDFIEGQLPNGQGNIKSIYVKTTMGKPAKVQEPGSKGGRK